MPERDATRADLEALELPELIGLAYQMELHVTEEISKDQLINLLLGECKGCRNKKH